MVNFFRHLPRWLLLALLVYAPWAYGCTRDWAEDLMGYLLLLLGVTYGLTLLAQRRLPQVPMPALLLSLGLLAVGWALTGNIYGHVDLKTFALQRTTPFLDGWPGTYAFEVSFRRLSVMSGMMVAFWIACEMTKSSEWRNRLWTTAALVGVSIVVLGLAQRFTEASAIFWIWGANSGRTFFATYRYHANAGTFLNLVIPLIVAQTALVFRRDTAARQGQKVFWALASLVAIAAAFVNVSKAAMTITGVSLILLAAWILLDWRRRRTQRKWEMPLALGALFAVIVTLAFSFGLQASENRWTALWKTDLEDNDRYLAYNAIVTKVLPASGWQGFGPGTFQVMFANYQLRFNPPLAGYWRHAHEDYLQTLVEWGWVGSALWAGFFFGGLGLGLTRLLRNYSQLSADHRWYLGASAVGLITILLHAAVDFPLQILSLQLYAAVALAAVWCLGVPRKGRTRKRKPLAEGAKDAEEERLPEAT